MFVEPKVFFLGMTEVYVAGLWDYLKYTGQEEFLDSWKAAKIAGHSDAECLCSYYAKLCYKSLVTGKNDNISRVRDIPENFLGILQSAHGSVLEHCSFNFVATDVSKVLTHELVRMRAGWAYSQTSGRYVRGDKINLVFDPILDPIKDEVQEDILDLEYRYKFYCTRMGLNGIPALEDQLQRKATEEELKKLGLETGTMSFDRKKKVTSALRRMLPNGQSNEIGFTINLRAIRHFIMLRSGRAAEWEIRLVTEQVYKFVKQICPLLFHGAKEEMVDGFLEITGMKLQPYDKES